MPWLSIPAVDNVLLDPADKQVTPQVARESILQIQDSAEKYSLRNWGTANRAAKREPSDLHMPRVQAEWPPQTQAVQLCDQSPSHLAPKALPVAFF